MDEERRILLLLEHDRGQAEPREPPLGSLGESLDVGRGEPNVRLAKERVGLRGRDTEIACSQLGQIAVGAKPGDRQPWVLAARDHDLNCVGGAIHELADRLLAGTARHRVPVLEHENDRRAVGELVDEKRNARLDDRPRPGAERPERAPADGVVDVLKRRDHVTPQPSRVGVLRVERDPGEGVTIGVRRRPLGQERGLPVPRRSADERERSLSAAAQPLDEIGALKQAVLHVWRAELGRDDVRRLGRDGLIRGLRTARHA